MSGGILFFDGGGEGRLEVGCSVIILVRMKRLLKKDRGDFAPLKREYPMQDVSFVAVLAQDLAHIFLLRAVTSLDALMMRSRRSWCSSSSLRKASNMGMKGEGSGAAISVSSLRGCF